MNPDTLAQLGELAPVAVVVSITIGIVQLVKYADETNKLVRFYPLMSFIVGMFLSWFVFHLDLVLALVTSLSASGTYEVTKRTIMGVPTRTIETNDVEPPNMGTTANFNNPNQPEN